MQDSTCWPHIAGLHHLKRAVLAVIGPKRPGGQARRTPHLTPAAAKNRGAPNRPNPPIPMPEVGSRRTGQWSGIRPHSQLPTKHSSFTMVAPPAPADRTGSNRHSTNTACCRRAEHARKPYRQGMKISGRQHRRRARWLSSCCWSGGVQVAPQVAGLPGPPSCKSGRGQRGVGVCAPRPQHMLPRGAALAHFPVWRGREASMWKICKATFEPQRQDYIASPPLRLGSWSRRQGPKTTARLFNRVRKCSVHRFVYGFACFRRTWHDFLPIAGSHPVFFSLYACLADSS